MATAEELLAEFTQVDKTLVISNDLRTITIPPTVPNLGVESDNEVLRLNFKMPRHIGDIDLSTFTIRINSLNAKDEGDVYTVTDASATDDDISFSWLVGPSATRYKGETKFNVCMVVFASDGVHVMQEFNTAPATLKVLEGLEVDESLLDAGYAEGFVDGGAQLNELRRSFWRTIANSTVQPGRFSYWDETTFSAMLPYPTDDELWNTEENIYEFGKPTPAIIINNADYLFYRCDLPVAYKDSGLPPLDDGYDFVSARWMFAYSTFTEIPDLYFWLGTDAQYAFAYAKCKRILGLDLGNGDNTILGKYAFLGCTELEDIDGIGEVVAEPLDFHWSKKLSAATIHRIIANLCYTEDYGLTNPVLRLSTAHRDDGKVTEEDIAAASEKGWSIAYV